jgi:hypothetical protein
LDDESLALLATLKFEELPKNIQDLIMLEKFRVGDAR